MMSTPAQSPAQALMLLSTDCIITSARIPESVVRQLVSEGRVVVRANRPRLTAAPLDLPGDPSVLAAELVERGKVSQPVEVVHRVLELAVGGMSQRKIADELPDVSSSTAGRIISAARQFDQQRVTTTTDDQDAWQLEAVG